MSKNYFVVAGANKYKGEFMVVGRSKGLVSVSPRKKFAEQIANLLNKNVTKEKATYDYE